MGLSPAQRIARPSVQVGGRTFPARATPTRWRQVLIKPPEDLPPFLLALAARIRYMSDMRILIIEDDRDAAAYLAKAFREAGHVADLAPRRRHRIRPGARRRL